MLKDHPAMTKAHTSPVQASHNATARFAVPEPLLADILSWGRPHDSETERRFLKEYLDKVPGMESDDFGNRFVTIGASPILYSCHVDTVGRYEGHQPLAYDATSGVLGLESGKPGQCLGADDGAGVWIMLCMIAANRPGLYVFHRGEEAGCLGSKWIAKSNPALLRGITAAIAFDRAGFSDVITHQAYGMTASDTFANSLAGCLNAINPRFNYRPDDTGVYTDTNEYADIVPECTNLSVGYFGQHGPRETLNVPHVTALRDAMLVLDWRELTIDRTPGDTGDYGRFMGPYGQTMDDWRDGYARKPLGDPDDREFDTMLALVRENPEIAAHLLLEAGFECDDILDAAFDLN